MRSVDGLLPDIDRGTNGSAFLSGVVLLGMALFSVVSTLLEIGMVVSIMTASYSGWYTALLSVTFHAQRHPCFMRGIELACACMS
jgi:ATP-binding cassette subfamily B protein